MLKGPGFMWFGLGFQVGALVSLGLVLLLLV